MDLKQFESLAGAAPEFSREEAVNIVSRIYGIQADAEPLASERDQNFKIKSEDGREFVLKIANSLEKSDVLEMQNQAMRLLNEKMEAGSCPELISSDSGKDLESVKDKEGKPHLVRLVTYIPGKILAEAKPHSPELLFRIGSFFAEMDLVLEDFSHPAARRELIWDSRFGLSIIDKFKRFIKDKGKADLVERLSRNIRENAAGRMENLPRGIIHNDGNDHNIIISSPSAKPESFGEMDAAGIIDFGDMVFSVKLAEPAVVCAYAMLNKSHPLQAACRVAAGYHSRKPLSEDELSVLFELIQLRLLMSVSISAYQKELNPDNEYLAVSENSVWKLLERIGDVSPDFACCRLRSACGYIPCPKTPRIIEWITARKSEIGPLTEPSLTESSRSVFDLSAGSTWLEGEQSFTPVEMMHKQISAWRDQSENTAGIGRYNEARLVYTGDRTIHLGMDFFMQPGTPVKAPLGGEVHSFRNNGEELDYGPAVILRHFDRVEEIEFYTLYGHLDPDSLKGLYPGKFIKKGDIFGWIGDSAENGGRPPHLHFQLISDILDYEGDFPAAAEAGERETWLSLCPDPNLIAGIPEKEVQDNSLSAPEIIRLRKKYLGGALSISYKKPLKIVRGRGCFLYDDTGRSFLDAVNNVPHVGHEHPRVVKAVKSQAAVLNTNTRYLHEELVRYARRLAALLPDPLRVCYIVNSGSEANDLALRMARRFTGERDIIALEGAYHGHLSSLIEISSYKFDGPGGQGKPPHTQTAVMPDLFRGPYRYGDEKAGEKYSEHIRDAVERVHGRGRGIAAFISESLLSCGGQIVLPAGYLKEAYRIIRQAGGLCIADEVQTGFGRTGSCFWGFETQNAVPDIVTLGKPIGNGFPLAAVVTTPEISEKFAGGMEYFNTYGGNPVACAAGAAVLDVIQEENLQENAQLTGTRLKSGLERLQEKYPVIGDVRGMGLFIGVEMVRDPKKRTPAPFRAAYAAERMREEGILISTDGPDRNVLKIKPPMVFNAENAAIFLHTLNRILAEDPVRVVI